MASVTSKEIPEEFNMFGELFTLYKKYYYPEHNPLWWEQMWKEFRALYNKYPTDICKNLIFACTDAIENRYKPLE